MMHIQLFIDGSWRDGASGQCLFIQNPATEEKIGDVACATTSDLEDAAGSALKGFNTWKAKSARERSQILGKAASLLKECEDDIARILTMEQGKPILESRAEITAAIEILEWFSGEAIRVYGRTIPARFNSVTQRVMHEPVGPVAAFTPWNFPVVQSIRKIAAALAAGCSIVMKGPEETPASCAKLFEVLHDAGVNAGAINLVFGQPGEISSFLIAHPSIRKISFTGSIPVGKKIAALAGQHMKRATMELGGHAPVIICNDADVSRAVKILTANKFRNAGQVCVSPTRFLVQSGVYEQFLKGFVDEASKINVGDGQLAATTMGPLAHNRRVEAVEAMVADATREGGKIECGGTRLHNKGYFFAPTIVSNPSRRAMIMNEEPFGPIAAVCPFDKIDHAISEANRLPVGLAAYAYSRSSETAERFVNEIDCGLLSINHHGIGLPETPFGGIKDSGYGSEGGIEGLEAYLSTKFVSQLH